MSAAIQMHDSQPPSWRGDALRADGQVLCRELGIDPWASELGAFAARAALMELGERRAADVRIVTGSRALSSDVELLRRIAAGGRLVVWVRLPSLSARVCEGMEPGGDGPRDRLDLVRALAAAGVPVGLAIPVAPGVNDAPAALGALFKAARDAGAQRAVVVPVEARAARRRPLAEDPELWAAWLGLVAAKLRRQYRMAGATEAVQPARPIAQRPARPRRAPRPPAPGPQLTLSLR